MHRTLLPAPWPLSRLPRTLVPAPLQAMGCPQPVHRTLVPALGWGALLPLQRWCLFGIGELAGRPYTDPEKTAPLMVILVPCPREPDPPVNRICI